MRKRLSLLNISFGLLSKYSSAFHRSSYHRSRQIVTSSMSSKDDNNGAQPTQGSKLADFYGVETATMYAGIMEKEMIKYKDDFNFIFETVQKAFLSGDKPKATLRVLDTCCGSCHMLQYIGEHFDKDDTANCELIGMDLSEEMIKVGKSIALQATLKVGNMLDMSEEQDGNYHLILNNFAMHHATPEQAKRAIEEYSRILEPGGVLFFSAWEGEGMIDYGEDMDMNAFFHEADAIKSWIASDTTELKILKCRTFVEEEMGNMNSIYIMAQKQ